MVYLTEIAARHADPRTTLCYDRAARTSTGTHTTSSPTSGILCARAATPGATLARPCPKGQSQAATSSRSRSTYRAP